MKHTIEYRLFAILIAVSCTPHSSAQALHPKNLPAELCGSTTSKQWFADLNTNENAAQNYLVACFESVRKEARDHYAANGQLERAKLIENMSPDFRSVMSRIAIAKVDKPTATVAQVIRGYLIDASAQLFQKKAQ